MKYRQMLILLTILGILGLGCGVPGLVAQAPTAIPVPPTKTPKPTFTPVPSPTNTIPPTATPIPTDTPPPTNTPKPTDTLAPTDTPAPPTDTPAPPTDTSVPPTATNVPPTKPPPPPTAPPPPTNTPMPKGQHLEGAHGVSGLVTPRDKTTFSVGEKAFFVYEAINHTKDPVKFELLGLKASDGQFQTSWVNPDVIRPGTPFSHDDGITFNAPGTYQVVLAICYKNCDKSEEGLAEWEEYPHGAATITVK